MANLTATLRPDGVTVDLRATLAVNELFSDTVMTIERLSPGLDVERVVARWIREGQAATITDAVDATAPLGRPSTWRLVATYEDNPPEVLWTTVQITPAAAGCWLTYGPYPHATLPVEVQAWPQDEIAPRESLHRVLRRRDVVALQDVWDLPAGDISFLVRDLDAAQALTAALTAGGTALLRTQPDSQITYGTPGSGRGAWYFTVGQVGRARLSGRSPDGRRLITASTRGSIPYGPGTPHQVPTLADLAALGTTLGTVAAFGTTLADLSGLGV